MEQPHIKSSGDRAYLLHQSVIETGEMFVLERGEDRLGQRDRASFDRITCELAPLKKNFGEDIERMFDVSTIGILEMRPDESVMDFVQRSRELFAVAPSPFLAADETADLAAGERNFFANWPTVVGMFFYERNEHFVRELTWLSQFRIGSDDDIFFVDAVVQFDLLRACRCTFWIVTEKRARDPQEGVLHVELFGASRLVLIFCCALCNLHKL